MIYTTQQIYGWLEEVKDPEIPVLSLVDLGVITEVTIEGESVLVEMTPTFVGCPAMEFMKEDVKSVLQHHGINDVKVTVTFRKPWNSDLISEKGKAALKTFGLAPPMSREVFADLEILESAVCPRCNSSNTDMKSPFGPTLCRSIHYCNDCRETFEQFKPV